MRWATVGSPPPQPAVAHRNNPHLHHPGGSEKNPGMVQLSNLGAVSSVQATQTPQQARLLERAQSGDDQAFEELVEPLRGELLAHCYRMLGSTHDAEDALQDAMLRAWRRLGTFDARGSLRGWLYTIATNTCLDIIGKRKRVLPQNHVPKTDPEQGAGQPLVDTVWLEPFPDETLDIEDGYLSPDARYEQRESVELAFVAALQLLPPRQRATLIMREVLGYSARETAESLDSTTASVNSALQRARKTIDETLPDETQQATLRSIGDEKMREIVEAYMDALHRGDVKQVVGMLTEDAAWSMPPLSTWFGGADLPEFMRGGPMSGEWKWRNVPTQANGQPAVAAYCWNEREGAYLAFALNVLTFEGDRVREITSFINRSIESDEPESYLGFPNEPVDERRMEYFFSRFGLPERLD
jgi:RNA polymerase sigma-70 factor, ECF subfamily